MQGGTPGPWSWSPRDPPIIDEYIVLIPDAADAGATERAGRGVPAG